MTNQSEERVNEKYTHLIELIGKLIFYIHQSGEYAKIIINVDKNFECSISGYSGYDASRYSDIEYTELGKKLQKAFDDLTELINNKK